MLLDRVRGGFLEEALPLLSSQVLRGHLPLASRLAFLSQCSGAGKGPCRAMVLKSHSEGTCPQPQH